MELELEPLELELLPRHALVRMPLRLDLGSSPSRSRSGAPSTSPRAPTSPRTSPARATGVRSRTARTSPARLLAQLSALAKQWFLAFAQHAAGPCSPSAPLLAPPRPRSASSRPRRRSRRSRTSRWGRTRSSCQRGGRHPCGLGHLEVLRAARTPTSTMPLARSHNLEIAIRLRLL